MASARVSYANAHGHYGLDSIYYSLIVYTIQSSIFNEWLLNENKTRDIIIHYTTL